MSQTRNFCIIAHIDHGKSTLADRLLESTHTLTSRQRRHDQVLDSMDLEQERGITIKIHAIQMSYLYKGETYILNLIDTPGHVDFSYEVSRAIAACEGALLVVDAAQGVQAQTIANLYLALENDLTIIPVINKVDLPNARTEEVAEELMELLGCSPDTIIYASAKTGLGVEDILAAIVARVPAPAGNPDAPLQAMIFDARFDPYKGVEVYFRIFNGRMYRGQQVRFFRTGNAYRLDEIGVLRLGCVPREALQAGDVGYMHGAIKTSNEVRIGDTITDAQRPCLEPVDGFTDVKPMLFAGLYPVVASEYNELYTAIEKLTLNDSSLVWEHERSAALGLGFRCGFLGLLHMEIVQERLKREFGIEVLATVPSVPFRLINSKGDTLEVHRPADMPPAGEIAEVQEPMVSAQIVTKLEYMGTVIQLCMDRRAVFAGQSHLTNDRVELLFELPLAEIVFDFFDRLKSISRGYASLDYALKGYQASDMVKMDILLNGEKVDALSVITHRTKAYVLGSRLCKKLQEVLPRQMFEIPVQAAIGSRVVARETVKAMRKNVLSKCYGGDVSRKRKLLEKQKEGKARMRMVGSVEVPQDAFIALLKIDRD